MTRHRIAGYLTLILAAVALGTGLWAADALTWMWISISAWWIGLAVLALRWQRASLAVDTYQTIWRPDERHPGTRFEKQGWFTVRPPESADRTGSGRWRPVIPGRRRASLAGPDFVSSRAR